MPNRLSRIYLAGTQSSSLYLHKISAILKTAKENAVRCERSQLQLATQLLGSPLCLTTNPNSGLLVENSRGGSDHRVAKRRLWWWEPFWYSICFLRIKVKMSLYIEIQCSVHLGLQISSVHWVAAIMPVLVISLWWWTLLISADVFQHRWYLSFSATWLGYKLYHSTLKQVRSGYFSADM